MYTERSVVLLLVVLVVTRREIDKQPLSAAGEDVPSVIVVCPLRFQMLVCTQSILCMNRNQHATLYGESESPDSHDGRFHNVCWVWELYCRGHNP